MSDNEDEKMCSLNSDNTCGVRSVAVKSTEVNTEKGLKTRLFLRVGGILPALGNAHL